MEFRQRTLAKAPTSQALLQKRLHLRERLLVARGADPTESLDIARMLAPDDLANVDRAARLIADVIEAGAGICIVGDYDADGATACAIALRGLRMFGASVSFEVPNRFTDGYGLSEALTERAAQHKPGLIVTVDNGIAAVAGIARANALGIPVVVTDHHLPGSELPDAAAIVNPNQSSCSFGSKHLAGCGVMFYVLIAMRRIYRQRGDQRGGAPLHHLLDLLALGTVADVVKLDANNRILVNAGLKRIRSGQACAGIRHLFEVAGRNAAGAGALDLGFYIGPRINAAGRMDDASIGIQCLITDDDAQASALAQALQQTNAERRAVQAEIQDEAERLAAAISDADGYSLVVAEPNWHEGVIGIVAGRLKEKFRRPTIVFASGGEGLLKGSGRSIPALHLRDALDAVDRQLPGVIEKFGGHAMAAGLTIRAEHLERFKAAFETHVRGQLSPSDLEEVIEHDGALCADDLTLDNADWMAQGIWGQGFPAPSFLTPAKVTGHRILKDAHTKLTVRIGGVELDAILFNQVLDRVPEVMTHGRLEVNEWNGRRSLQMLLTHAIPA